MNKKSITILALHLNYGGVEKYISSLCKMLENDYNITIITTYNNNNKTAFEFSNKIKIDYLINGMPNKLELINAIKNRKIFIAIKEGLKAIKIVFLKKYRNIRAIKKINSDYVITTREFHNRLVSKYLKKGIIKIATEHNYHNDNKKYVSKLVKSVNNFDYFVVVSKELKEYYEKYIKNAKVVYIPNVIDNMPDKISDLSGNNFISIGRFSKEKGFLDLINVFLNVKDKLSDSKLFLIGDGDEKDNIKKKIEECNLTDSIIMPGFLNKAEIEKYMNRSKLYIMTSYTESFGLVLIEAMSYGIPCIAYDSASGPREIINGKNGKLIRNRDKNLMATEIINIAQDKEKINLYSKEAINTSKKYLIKNVKKNWLRMLDGEDAYERNI